MYHRKEGNFLSVCEHFDVASFKLLKLNLHPHKHTHTHVVLQLAASTCGLNFFMDRA